jgi:hypothetical protein
VNHNDNALIEVESYTNRIFETHQNSSQRVIDYKIDIENSTLKVDKALPYGLILNELITNSIKHAKIESLILDLKLNLIDDKIELSYSDNGTNFYFENKKDSLGLLIIEGMVKQLKGITQEIKLIIKSHFPMTEHKNRILIVEEVLIAFSVKRMLEPFFLSEIAHDYEEAKLLLSHKLFDLVLIDISLSEKKQGWIWRNSSMIIFRFHSFLQPL